MSNKYGPIPNDGKPKYGQEALIMVALIIALIVLGFTGWFS
jgi:cytochrome b